MSYVARFIGWLVAYSILLFGSIWLLGTDLLQGSPWRFVVALQPVPAAIGVLVLFVRRVGELDELLRLQHLQALAVAFGGTVLVTFSWGFLEGVGVPPLSGFVVYGVLMVLYLIGLARARSRYR